MDDYETDDEWMDGTGDYGYIDDYYDDSCYYGDYDTCDCYRDLDDGGIWYDGYYCADAMDYEEAETEYWNTH